MIGFKSNLKRSGLFVIIILVVGCKVRDGTVRTHENGEQYKISKICQVHQYRMHNNYKPIWYGLYKFDPKMNSNLFPNAKSKHYHDGCRVYKTRPRIYKSYVCMKCNKARKKNKVPKQSDWSL